MADTFTPKIRSEIMSRIRAVNTGPERKTAQVLKNLGLKVQAHDRKLPGVPDFSIPKQKVSIFVHGCFWHQHSCSRGSRPKSNVSYWLPKLSANVSRFQRTRRKLNRLGWKVFVVWECQTKSEKLMKRINRIASTIL